jgi:membrane protease YdiL (CAAX protease family)
MAAIAVVALAALAAKDGRRILLGNLLLVLVTVFVGTFLFNAFNSSKLGKTNTAVAADQAEMQLRIISATQALQDRTLGGNEAAKGKGLPIQRKKTYPGVKRLERNSIEDTAYETAINCLKLAIHQYPNTPLYKAKLAVILGHHAQLTQQAEISRLVGELKATTGSDEASSDMRRLGGVLEQSYIKQSIQTAEQESAVKLVKTVMPPGWYRDHLLQAVMLAAGDHSALAKLQQETEQRYIILMAKLLGIFCVGLVAFLIGIGTIAVQFAVMARKREPLPDEVGLVMPWKVIYAVFIGWFSLEIATTFLEHAVQGHLPSLSSEALALALTTTITYLISNASAPLLIWKLALKPRDLPFLPALHITSRTSTAGPVRLVLYGLLGWCAAVPIVAVLAFSAQHFFNVQGSDNPVLGQILQAANASSIAATLIFYLTLGVLAPLFEETLFRGFIYSSLKTRLGAGWAIFASATLFALMHFDRGGFLMLFGIGVVLAYLFEKTRSLVPSMICHGLWNSGTFTLALLILGS